MKHELIRTSVGLILFTTLFGIVPEAQARSCKLSGVAGTYGYTTSGTIPTLGALAAVGLITPDASGHLTGAQTTSFHGAIVHETLSGTYTVNAHGTGTATVNGYHPGAVVG